MPTPLGTYRKIQAVEHKAQYSLLLTFDDGEQRLVDLEPLLVGPLFGQLRDPNLFAQVFVNPDTGTVEWPNGADFNPNLLYDWPEVGARVIAERSARYSAAK
jgi:hypothetical protein